MGKFILVPCTSLAFSTCLGPSCVSNKSNTDEILFSKSPMRAHCWTCSSAAPNVPILVFSWETHLHQRRVWGFEFRELRLAGPYCRILRDGFADSAHVLATMFPARLNCFPVLPKNRLQFLSTAAGKFPPEKLGASLATDQVLVASSFWGCAQVLLACTTTYSVPERSLLLAKGCVPQALGALVLEYLGLVHWKWCRNLHHIIIIIIIIGSFLLLYLWPQNWHHLASFGSDFCTGTVAHGPW